MAIILVTAMIVVALIVEWLHRRNRIVSVESRQAEPSIKTENVEGILVSKKLDFHPFHMWVSGEDAQTAKIGLDDLARRLSGPAAKVVLPAERSEIHAGQPCIAMQNGKRITRLVSPVSGEVLEVNPALKDEPDLAFRDPYGRGWLFRIRNWRLNEERKSLINGDSVTDWMRSALQRMRYALNNESEEVFAQDGGSVCEDFGQCLDRHDMFRIIRDTLGTEATEISQ
jgi:glycine cleavage system H protein